MANWAYTSYVIEGKQESIEKIYNAIQNPILEEGAGEGWEGGVLKALGIQWEPRTPEGKGYYMRGFIEPDTVSCGDDVLRFDAQEAWGVTDFYEVLEKNIPDIKVFYIVEEQGEEIFATNDKEGKYFTTRYYADCCIDGNYHTDYFYDKEFMYEWLKDITDGRVKTMEDVDKFNDDYEDACEEDENFIHIYEYKIVD